MDHDPQPASDEALVTAPKRGCRATLVGHRRPSGLWTHSGLAGRQTTLPAAVVATPYSNGYLQALPVKIASLGLAGKTGLPLDVKWVIRSGCDGCRRHGSRTPEHSRAVLRWSLAGRHFPHGAIRPTVRPCVLFGAMAGAQLFLSWPKMYCSPTLGARGSVEAIRAGGLCLRIPRRSQWMTSAGGFRFAVEAGVAPLQAVLIAAKRHWLDLDWVVCHRQQPPHN